MAESVREQDQYMPIANVIRIMRRILPRHAKISDDAKETIQESVSEFISFITAEANNRCQSEERKTVTAEDLLWAMGKLGFDDYVQPLSFFIQRYRDSESESSASVRRAPSLVMPPPPQLPPHAVASDGNCYGYGYGYGFGFGTMVDFNQGYNRDNDVTPSSAGFGPSFDYSFQNLNRDPM